MMVRACSISTNHPDAGSATVYRRWAYSQWMSTTPGGRTPRSFQSRAIRSQEIIGARIIEILLRPVGAADL